MIVRASPRKASGKFAEDDDHDSTPRTLQDQGTVADSLGKQASASQTRTKVARCYSSPQGAPLPHWQ